MIPAAGRAQSYSVDWFKVAGGGGSSSNGQFVVHGTIGQPDAANALNGGNYSVTGGFWSLLNAVQTPGAPWLSVRLATPDTVVVSWAATATGFVLQENSAIDSGTWSNVTNAVSVADGKNQVTFPPSAGNHFYRLKQ